MTFSTAQQIIDNELQNKDKYTGFEIDLFGGEPFLQFELIKQITKYACQELNDFPHTIFLTTNGTLVHGDVQKWLIDHKDCVICGLSLMKPCLTLRAGKSMINNTAVLLITQNRVKKRFQKMTPALVLIRLQHPEKAAMSPISSMDFFRS